MSDYTPRVEQLKEAFLINQVSAAEVRGTYTGQTGFDAEIEFDRAIAKIRADAKVEALREAVSDFEAHVGVGEFDEQTRRDGRHHAHIDEAWEYQGPYMDWLRNRADNLEAS